MMYIIYMNVKTNFTLNNYQLATLKNKSRLYSTLSNIFTKTYFKIEKGSFHFYLRGSQGLLSTTIPVEYEGPTQYFSVDYTKWATSLQKFEDCEKILFEVNDSLLRLSVEGTSDIINLGISSFDESSSEATIMNTFISTKGTEIYNQNNELVLNDEILDAFNLADSLFCAQGKANSIGLSKNRIMYSDRSAVLRVTLSEPLDDNLFKNLPEGEDYIYIHSFILKLLQQLSKFNPLVSFNNEYELIYWADEDTELIIASEEREVALPDEEQWNAIRPENEDSAFSTSLDVLREGLAFFTGFYVGSAWKPLTFDVQAGKEVVLNYKHPTAEIKKSLPNVTGTYAGNFMLESETLGKIVTKVGDHYKDQKVDITFNYDDVARGVYCSINGGAYEAVLSKLRDDEE